MCLENTHPFRKMELSQNLEITVQMLTKGRTIRFPGGGMEVF